MNFEGKTAKQIKALILRNPEDGVVALTEFETKHPECRNLIREVVFALELTLSDEYDDLWLMDYTPNILGRYYNGQS
jgi:hypothetical protein